MVKRLIITIIIINPALVIIIVASELRKVLPGIL